MTRLLLDTHTVFWAAFHPDRLGPSARAALADQTSEVLVSPVSSYELSFKYRLGRMPGAKPFIEHYAEVVDGLLARSLPIDDRHALAAGSLDWDHRDPFDRLLVAQAAAEAAVLVTKDQEMRTAPGVSVLW